MDKANVRDKRKENKSSGAKSESSGWFDKAAKKKNTNKKTGYINPSDVKRSKREIV